MPGIRNHIKQELHHDSISLPLTQSRHIQRSAWPFPGFLYGGLQHKKINNQYEISCVRLINVSYSGMMRDKLKMVGMQMRDKLKMAGMHFRINVNDIVNVHYLVIMHMYQGKI